MFYTFSLLSIRAGMQEVDKNLLKYVSWGKRKDSALLMEDPFGTYLLSESE